MEIKRYRYGVLKKKVEDNFLEELYDRNVWEKEICYREDIVVLSVIRVVMKEKEVCEGE